MAAGSPVAVQVTPHAAQPKDVWTFVGAAIIVASTTYIAHREAVSGGRKT